MIVNFHFDIFRLYAIFHLFNHETEIAGKYLQQILQFGKEDFTVTGEILFRLVHNVYCLQTGDYTLAADVYRKNMKYIDSKLDLEGMDSYKPIFSNRGKVIRFKKKANVAHTNKLLKQIEDGEGPARLYQ